MIPVKPNRSITQTFQNQEGTENGSLCNLLVARNWQILLPDLLLYTSEIRFLNNCRFSKLQKQFLIRLVNDLMIIGTLSISEFLQ